ncbi:GDSL-type esterase/lipase family protein [Streptomyces mangrovi]|uniref:GDSL-type esterase/lipase family protein n=1 Tax=Streptomyces mangrovi TaxID=1206892 RepID=UPI00399C6AF0
MGVTSQVKAAVGQDVRMRVLFVGDSMTIGSAGEHTWRHRMWRHLERTRGPHGTAYEIVGPRDALYDKEADAPVSHDYADPAFPAAARRHLAGWGEGWLHMAPVIAGAVREHRADTLLVFLGLIDLGFYTGSGATAANVRRFVAEARSAEPRVRMVLLPVIPNIRARHDVFFAAECERFNELLARAVAELSTPASPLLTAVPPHDWDLARDTYDGTHPTARGEHRIAAAFADAMHRAWGVGSPYAAGAVGAQPGRPRARRAEPVTVEQ